MSDARRLIAALKRAGALLTTVESCTGGLLASRLTDVPGASEVFWGGAVTYRNSAKTALARVPAQALARDGAVSERMAAAMARGGLARLARAAERPRALLAISVTGLAGPRGDGSGLRIGTGFVGVATRARGSRKQKLSVFAVRPPSSKLSRQAHKRRFANEALRHAASAAAALLAGATGCSSGPSGRYQHAIHHLALDNVQFRRPPVESATDSVDPDEEGYRTTPMPSARLGCQNRHEFFANLDFGKVGNCLNSIKEEYRAFYRLERDIQPKLVLEDPEKAPQCLRELLPELPVPREIVFQTDEEAENPLSCYASRLDLSADRFLGIPNPLKHTYVQVGFPLISPDLAATPARTVNFLASWVLTPFFSDTRELSAKVVPNVVCRACMGDMGLLKPEDRPVYWPASPDGNP